MEDSQMWYENSTLQQLLNLFLGCIWHHHFLKSKTKELPKLLSLSGMRGGKFVYLNNFSAQEHEKKKKKETHVKLQSYGGAWHKAMTENKEKLL